MIYSNTKNNTNPLVAGVLGISLALASSIALAQEFPQANVAHLAPFADTLEGTAVSVDVESTEVIESVVFNVASGYLDLGLVIGPTGTDGASAQVDVDVFAPPGSAGMPAITDTFDLDFGTDYTIAAIGNGTLQPLDFLLLDDTPVIPLVDGEPGGALLRVVHAAPFADNAADTEVSIRLQDGSVVAGLTNVPYGADSGFIQLPAGNYNLVVATPDGSTPLIDPVAVDLTDGQVITVFAVGDIINQPLGITGQNPDGTIFEIPLERGVPEFLPIPTLSWIGLFMMIALLSVVAIRRLA